MEDKIKHKILIEKNINKLNILLNNLETLSNNNFHYDSNILLLICNNNKIKISLRNYFFYFNGMNEKKEKIIVNMGNYGILLGRYKYNIKLSEIPEDSDNCISWKNITNDDYDKINIILNKIKYSQKFYNAYPFNLHNYEKCNEEIKKEYILLKNNITNKLFNGYDNLGNPIIDIEEFYDCCEKTIISKFCLFSQYKSEYEYNAYIMGRTNGLVYMTLSNIFCAKENNVYYFGRQNYKTEEMTDDVIETSKCYYFDVLTIYKILKDKFNCKINDNNLFVKNITFMIYEHYINNLKKIKLFVYLLGNANMLNISIPIQYNATNKDFFADKKLMTRAILYLIPEIKHRLDKICNIDIELKNE